MSATDGWPTEQRSIPESCWRPHLQPLLPARQHTQPQLPRLARLRRPRRPPSALWQPARLSPRARSFRLSFQRKPPTAGWLRWPKRARTGARSDSLRNLQPPYLTRHGQRAPARACHPRSIADARCEVSACSRRVYCISYCGRRPSSLHAPPPHPRHLLRLADALQPLLVALPAVAVAAAVLAADGCPVVLAVAPLLGGRGVGG